MSAYEDEDGVDGPFNRAMALAMKDDYVRQLEQSYGAAVALLARVIACDGGHGSYGFEARIAMKAREDALDLIAAIRPDWTAKGEWDEAYAEVSR
jgi:hypothetical protein